MTKWQTGQKQYVPIIDLGGIKSKKKKKPSTCSSLSRHRGLGRWSDDENVSVRQCDGDGEITIVRWRDNDDVIEHRFIVIVPPHHRHRVAASLPSYHNTIAPLHHRRRTKAPSSSHYHTIAPDLDGEMVNYEAPSRFHTVFIFPQGIDMTLQNIKNFRYLSV